MTKERIFHHDKLKKKIEIVRSSSECGVAGSYSTQIFVTCCSFMELATFKGPDEKVVVLNIIWRTEEPKEEYFKFPNVGAIC